MVTTDDLLTMLVFLVIRTELPTWCVNISVKNLFDANLCSNISCIVNYMFILYFFLMCELFCRWAQFEYMRSFNFSKRGCDDEFGYAASMVAMLMLFAFTFSLVKINGVAVTAKRKLLLCGWCVGVT